jgi:uncharacterized protein (DUF885 family)
MAIAADTLSASWPRLLAALALAAALGCAPLARTPSSSQSQQSSPESRRINDIFENYFEAYLELFPLYATQIGDHRYDHRLSNNLSAEHRAAQRQLYQETLEQLAAIDRSALVPAERLYHEVLDRSLRLRLEASRFPSHLLPVRQLGLQK